MFDASVAEDSFSPHFQFLRDFAKVSSFQNLMMFQLSFIKYFS